MNLKELRKYKGFTQETAAKALGIPLRTYKRYESEKSYEKTYKYKAIFDKLFECEKSHKITELTYSPNVLIIGAGYVGYNFGKVLNKKTKVSFLDIDKSKVCKLKNEGFDAVSSLDDLTFFDVAVISLPTNFNEETKSFDTKDIKEIISNIFDKNKNCLVIIKSTVSVGFTRTLAEEVGKDIYFMPEFLREKTAYEDSLRPSRLIIGANRITEKLKNFSILVETCIDVPRKTIFMSTEEAEATKLFSNAYLAMRVAFFNELDTFASKQSMSTENIIKGIGLDPRIGDYYNNPSFGYGGYCLPKDTKVINAQTNSELFKGVISANENRKDFYVSRIIKEAFSKNDHPTIGFVGIESSQNTHKSSGNELIDKIKKYPVNAVVFKENVNDFDNFCDECDLIVYDKKDLRLIKYKNKVYKY